MPSAPRRPPPKPRGRPSAFKPEYVAQAFRLCLLGATDDDLAAFFGVSRTTVTAWKGAHPDFLAALKGGKAQADAEVAHRLYRRALGYSHRAVKITVHAETGTTTITPYTERYAPDTTACIFWLKNRRPDQWRDRAAEKPEDDSPDEQAQRVREQLDAMDAATLGDAA